MDNLENPPPSYKTNTNETETTKTNPPAMNYGFDDEGRQLMCVRRYDPSVTNDDDQSFRPPTPPHVDFEDWALDYDIERGLERERRLHPDFWKCKYDSGLDSDEEERECDPLNFLEPDDDERTYFNPVHIYFSEQFYNSLNISPGKYNLYDFVTKIFEDIGLKVKFTYSYLYNCPVIKLTTDDENNFFFRDNETLNVMNITYWYRHCTDYEFVDMHDNLLYSSLITQINIDSVFDISLVTENLCRSVIVREGAAQINVNSDSNPLVLEPQSETGHVIEERGSELQEDTTPGVDLVENRPSTESRPIDVLPDPSIGIAFGMPAHEYPELMSRYNNIGTITWTTTNTPGSIIDRIDLPIDVYSVLSTNPTTLPLLQYVYYRPNITIKFQLNSTRFHSGLLVIGMQYYSFDAQNSIQPRLPLSQAQVWQLDSATTLAADANSVLLEIPFQSPLNMIPVTSANIGSSAYYASVFVSVVSPLRIGEGGSQSVSLTRQIKFETSTAKTQFFGQISRRNLTLTPQGLFGTITNALSGGSFRNLISSAEGLLSGLGSENPTSNQDRPAIPIDPTAIITYPVATLSHGDGPTTIRTLRLQPNATTPHHPSQVPRNATSLDSASISDVWGYVATFQISATDPIDKLICTIPITPMLGALAPTIDGHIQFLPTPMAGVANQYCYWSGEICLKFRLVKAQPHSVRLRFSTNPGDVATGPQLVDLFSTIQDFEEVAEIDYFVPYCGPTPTLPTVLENGTIPTTGSVQVRMESFLTTMNSISNTIDLVVLAKRGKSLSFHVPRSIAIPTYIPDHNDSVSFSYSNNTGRDIYYYRFEIQSGVAITISDVKVHKHNTGISFSRPVFYSFYNLPNNTRIVLSSPVAQSNIALLLFNYQILPTSAEDDGDYYFTMTHNQEGNLTPLGESREVFTMTNKPPGDIWNGPTVFAFGSRILNSIVDLPGNSRILFLRKQNLSRALTLEPQNDDREIVTNAQGPTTTPDNAANLVYGEDYPLISSLRRFQEFSRFNTQFTFNLDYDAKTPNMYTIPVRYDDALDLDTDAYGTNLGFNARGFRFGKGSIRYNCIFNQVTNTNNYVNPKIKIYHVPPNTTTLPKNYYTWTSTDNNLLQRLSMLAHEVVSDLDTSASFEIPYYNYTNCVVNGYVGNDNENTIVASGAKGLGSLAFVCYLPSNFLADLVVERALGDDADLYVFQGWPHLNVGNPTYVNVNATQTPNLRLTPQDLCSKTCRMSEGAAVMSNIAMELKETRRGRLALRKFFDKQTSALNRLNLEPQDLREDLEADRLALDLVYLYKDPTHHISTRTQELLTDYTPPYDSELERKAAIQRAATRLLAERPSTTVDFFAATDNGDPKNPWYKNAKIWFQSQNLSIPDTFKRAMANLDARLGGWPSTLVDVLKVVVPVLAGALTSTANLFFVVTSIQMAMSAGDAWVKSIAITSLLAYFGVIPPNKMGLALICNEVIFYITKRARQGYLYISPQGEGEEEDVPACVAQWTSLLIGGVAAACGLSSSKTWSEGIKNFAGTLGSVTNAWHRLLTKSCTFVIDYIIWLTGMENPGTLAQQELDRMGVDGKEWLERAYRLVDPAIRDNILQNAAKRAEVAKAYEEGSAIIRTLGLKGGQHPKAGAVLSIWRKLCELYSETGEIPDSVKANQTPICVWIHGAPGLGKSEVAKTLAVQLSTMLGISHQGDPFFVRRPRKYWDGYFGQPIIIFDDALQIKDANFLPQFLEDWYGVMTPAPFSPEFSTIAEKKKFVTPQIVIATSNELFPEIPGISNIASFHRRRDFLIDVELSSDLKEQGITGPEDLRIDPEILKNFDHLTFRQMLSTTNRKDGKIVSVGKGEPMRLNGLIAKMAPHIEHLRKIRTQSAETQVKLSSSLDPLTIEQARKDLIDELSKSVAESGQIAAAISTITSGAGSNPQETYVAKAAVGATPGKVIFEPQGDEGGALKAVKFTPSKTTILSSCEFACASLPLKDLALCGTELDYRVCEVCKHIVGMSRPNSQVGGFARARLVPTFVLGQAEGPAVDVGLDEKYNTIVDRCVAYYSQLAGSEHFVLPLKRGAISQLKTAIDVGDIFETTREGNSLWSCIKLPLKVALFLAAGALAIFGIYASLTSIMSTFCGGNGGEQPDILKAVPQLASSGAVPTARRTAGKIMTVPQEAVSDFLPTLTRNMCELTLWSADGFYSRAWALGIGERYLVTTYHTFCKDWEVSRLEVKLRGNNCEAGTVAMLPGGWRVTQINGTDLCIVQLVSKRVPAFRKIVHKIVPKDRIGAIGQEAVIVDVRGFATPASSAVIHHSRITSVESMVSYPSMKNLPEVMLKGFSYPLEGKGLCGSVVVDKKTGYIVGMHVAGGNGLGYANILCSVFFDNLDINIDVETPNLEPGNTLEPLGEFVPIGLVPQNEVASLPLKTNIRKAISYEVLGPVSRVPCKMITEGEPKPGLEALRKAVAKEGKPTLNWKQEDVEEVTKFLSNRIIDYCKPTNADPRVRTIEEAIVGVPNVPFMEALKRNTSVGWPLSTLGIGSKKSKFVQYSEDSEGLHVVALHPKLVEIYNANHQKRKNGIIPFSVYHNFLKDERLPPGKNPRLINGCPFEQVIDLRRYMLDFCSAVQFSGPSVGISIGMNVHGMDWSNLANRLLAVGSKIVCGDYSGFGPGLDPDLVLRCHTIVEDWYRTYTKVEEEDIIIRRTLFENLAFSYEISQGTVLQTLCGSPSGNAYTALINSMVNLMYLMLAWLDTFRGTTLADLNLFWKLNAIAVYGDDLIMSVSDLVVDRWNNEVLQNTFAKYGIKYTDANKSGDIRKWVSMDDASFLKCYFVPHPTRGEGFYLGALDKAMIQDIPSWIHLGDDRVEASLANSVEAVHLAYAWGEEYYNFVLTELRNFWRDRGRAMEVRSWSYLDQMYFGELMSTSLPKDIDPLNYQWV